MDYELVIDLTDATIQTYTRNIQSLLMGLIPTFNIKDREKYFTSIQLKCNLNTATLPDATILPKLQDLNNKKPIDLGGGLIKFVNIERPSMENFMKQHQQRNKCHKKRMNNTMNKALAASLPSPKYPKRTDPLPPHILHQKRVRAEHPVSPPNYNDVTPPPITNHSDEEEEGNNNMQIEYEAKLVEQIQEYNDKKSCIAPFGLSDIEWRIQHALLPKEKEAKQPDTNYEEDGDYALALRLQEQENVDDDMKMALQLQKEEDAKTAVDNARNRYRNPNFVDWGSRPEDYAVNAAYYPQPTLNNEERIVGQLRRWRPSRNDIRMNANGSIPAVLRRFTDDNDDEPVDDDAVLNAFSYHSSAAHLHGFDELYGLNSIRRRHCDDSWQRLPIRTLLQKDVDILSKSSEKKACPICMNCFSLNDTTRILPCFHEFHKDCVDKWFQQQNDKGNDASCPLDRKKIKAITNQTV